MRYSRLRGRGFARTAPPAERLPSPALVFRAGAGYRSRSNATVVGVAPYWTDLRKSVAWWVRFLPETSVRRIHQLLLGAAAVVVTLSCGDSTGPSNSVSQFVAAVSVAGGATASLQRGDPPATAGGPAVTATTPPSAITGGSAQVSLTSGQQFSVVIVAVEGRPDYYRLTLPASATSAQIVVTLSQDIPPGSFTLQFAAGTSATAIGTYAAWPVSVVTVGTGDVQVSVSWNTQADVDLHVVDPSGEEIYYGNETSASGGQLDLDSNAGCGTDDTRNENITWPSNGAPSGQYIVRLDHWDNCGATSTNWVVTVRVKGQSPKTYNGTFTGAGDQGGLGSGIPVTTFNR